MHCGYNCQNMKWDGGGDEARSSNNNNKKLKQSQNRHHVFKTVPDAEKRGAAGGRGEACERTQSCSGRCRRTIRRIRRIRRIRGLGGRWIARGVQKEIWRGEGGGGNKKKKDNNVPHKGNKSGEIPKDTYQFPISAIILSSHTALARGNCLSPLLF